MKAKPEHLGSAPGSETPTPPAKGRGERGPQHEYGFRGRADWGCGIGEAEYVIGDVVYLPEKCAAVLDGRAEPGLHRVDSCFSIGEDASFYYRLAPTRIDGIKGQLRIRTDWNKSSGRLHVIPGKADFTLGWIRLFEYPNGADEPPARERTE